MTTSRRIAVAVLAAGLLAACSSSSDSSNAATRACAPKTFACDGHTPGFWSNDNGCDWLESDGLVRVNEILALRGLSIESCDQIDEILKVDAKPMSGKLFAMWTAFALNQWAFWECDCYGGDIDFEWTPERWLPEGASETCEAAVEGWFDDPRVAFGDLEALVEELLLDGASECEQETLKNLLDAANNDAKICLCDCPSGATSGSGGSGGWGD